MTYSFLIEMAWKSAIIAGAALAFVALLRSRSAADRGAVLKIGVALLLALPLVAFAGPALVVETPAPAVAAVAEAPAAAPIVAAEAALPAAELTAAPATGGSWDDPSILFLLLYAGGLAMVGGRLAAGLWTLRRWTRSAAEVTSPEWLAALARAGGDGLGIRLLVSEDASSPLSWGWSRPAILIDRDTLRQPEEADAILAHEVAHVARRDWPALLLSRIAVALFWFNPLVWLLDREVAQQAEEAADSHAAARVEPARYAQTLLDWARHGAGALPANAIAAGEPGLARRVKAILDGRVNRASGSTWTMLAALGCVTIAAPVAAIELVGAAPEPPAAPAAPRAPAVRPPAGVAPATPVAPPTGVPGVAPPAPIAAVPPAPAAPLAAAVQAQARAHVAAQAAARAAAHPHVDEKAIEAQVEAAVAQAMKAVEAATAQAAAAADRAVEQALASVAHGAVGMEAGAKGMEQGAAHMRAEAGKLRNRDYREEQIRKAAARGDKLTHEDLLEAAEGLEEGAEGMKEGAREMREAAAEMRAEARKRRH
jgi:bla regulator protein blaR1